MERAGRRHDTLTGAAQTIIAGGVAGVLAGGGMAVFLMIYAGATGLGIYTPLKLIGGTLYRHGALVRPGLAVVFWGLVLHLAIAGAIGILYAALVKPGTDPMAAVAGGIVFGLVVWLVMTFVVVPIVDPTMRPAVPIMSMGWFGAHVVYGAVLGLAQDLRELIVV